MNSIRALLALPFARQVLVFNEHWLSACDVYKGLSPYAALNGADYVRWALDSIERLLALPHEDVLDDALMPLAVHTGERDEDICMAEIHEELHHLCAALCLAPPTGAEAVKLFVLAVLEDLVGGLIPPQRTREVLSCLHLILWPGNYGAALNAISGFEWRLEEWDDLSRLRLEKNLPLTREEILQEFRQYAARLVASMRVKLELRDGLWHLRLNAAAPP